MAVATKISVDAAGVAALSESGGLFALKMALRAFLGGRHVFCSDPKSSVKHRRA